MQRQLHPGLSALAKVALMFAPALPAYLWLWPNVTGTQWHTPAEVATYTYFLTGSLIIGLYHIGWMGPWGALGCAFIGLLFGAIRWRAGSWG